MSFTKRLHLYSESDVIYSLKRIIVSSETKKRQRIYRCGPFYSRGRRRRDEGEEVAEAINVPVPYKKCMHLSRIVTTTHA